MTADEIRRLKYKTIIFSSVTRPILRKTVPYKKFKCYKFGTIKREIRPLQRLVETYYTVENLKYNDNNNSQEPKFDTNEAQIKTKLVFIINKVIKIFGKIDFNVEYVKENNNIIAKIFLAPPLSLNDIKGLEELSSKLDFHYNAIADKEKINRKNRNSLRNC